MTITDRKKRLTFVKVDQSDEHCKLLYSILEQRIHSISHSAMPSYEEHLAFVREEIYIAWYLIFEEGSPIGTCYIDDNNCIGLNLIVHANLEILSAVLEFVANNHVPLPSQKSRRNGKFTMNVAAENKGLIRAMEERGAQAVQISFLV